MFVLLQEPFPLFEKAVDENNDESDDGINYSPYPDTPIRENVEPAR